MMKLRRFAYLFFAHVVALSVPVFAEAEAEAVNTETNDVSTVRVAQPEDALLAEARAMLVDPSKYKNEDWSSLSERLEKAIPETSSAQQKLALEIVDARHAGRTHESIQPLIRQQEEIEQQIKNTIESLPEVAILKTKLDQSHRDLLDTIKLRQQIQKYVNPDSPQTPAMLPAGIQRSK